MANVPKVVNDTNVWLSALFFHGNEAKIVQLIEESNITSVTSDFILQELKEKMVMKFNTPSYAVNATIFVTDINDFSKISPIRKNIPYSTWEIFDSEGS